MIRLPLEQGTQAWLDARRDMITGTDIPVLLSLSPYKCEADLADEKAGAEQPEPSLRMRIGSAVQGLIGEEYSRRTGRRVQAVHGMVRHPDVEWAAASPDFRVVGDKRLVEAKRSASRTRFADGVPQDIEAQVAWQLGCAGLPVADVAVLTDDDLLVFEQPADPALFSDLLDIAADFRRRLAAGGPFARDAARIRRDHPRDDGGELMADDPLIEAVHSLAATRTERKRLEAAEDELETLIKGRMGDMALLVGPDFRVSWKTTKDVMTVDWKSVADGLLRQIPEAEAQALVGIATTARPGMRPFRVVMDKEF